MGVSSGSWVIKGEFRIISGMLRRLDECFSEIVSGWLEWWKFRASKRGLKAL